ncbi:DMT family transporter [Capnocytophaga canimorsus]|uniref:DMT family transporter n=1 Tax=Capnocytophaga canimorsus TaxID=28188 RepID=UPI0037D56682
MHWFYLLLAGLLEVSFVFCLGKARESVSQQMYWWYVGFDISLTGSMWLMMRAIQHIPLGTAYAVWTGIGAAGSVIIGMLFFKDPITFWRVFFLFTLIASIVGLKYISG